MKTGLRGNLLPESYEDFQALDPHQRIHSTCIECGSVFSSGNTQTPAGWRDTQIVGMCEKCYDALFAFDEETGRGT